MNKNMRKVELIYIILLIGMFSIFGCKHKETINLKVMSYNIRHGEGMDTVLDLSRAATIIKLIEPDLCG